MIRDPNWGLEGPKGVKTIRKHHEYPPQKYTQTHLETFFSGSFFTPNHPKTAKSPTLPLQAPRHLQASCRGIKDKIGVWRAQNASKPSQNIINTPPKYPQTHLEPFFSGHFSPQIARKRLSPQAPPLQATRPLQASRKVK